MKTLIAMQLFPLALLSVSAQGADWPTCGTVDHFPEDQWVQGDAHALGWDSDALADAFRYLDSLESSGAMVVHRGILIGSWGDPASPHIIASLRKSLLSGLIGAARQDGRIKLTSTLAELGIDDNDPPLTDIQKTATLKDLISTRSGIYHSAHYETGGWKRIKSQLAGSAPGEIWLYNNWDFNVAASILEQLTGEALGESFARRIAKQVGMQDFQPDSVSYVGNESYAEQMMGNVSDFPAYMFEISPRDLARFGVLYLNCGRWKGQEVIPASWVLESTTGRPISDGAPDVDFYKGYGSYGYMWWVDTPEQRTWPEIRTREPVYFGQGANGHYLWVAPYLDLVVVHQVATPGGISTFDQLRRRIFGQPGVSDNAFKHFLALVLAAHPGPVD